MKREYTLPSGKGTTSTARYLREWNKLSKPFAKAMGVNRHAFDPGVSYRTKQGVVFSVPVSVLNAFNETVVPALAIAQYIKP